MSELSGQHGRLIISGTVNTADTRLIREFALAGGKIILLDQRALPKELLGKADAIFTAHRQEFITMNIAESSIFDGIDILDTAWFSDDTNVPYVATGRYSVDRFNRDVCVLAETLEWHGYNLHPYLLQCHMFL